jgi:hypothetical protein
MKEHEVCLRELSSWESPLALADSRFAMSTWPWIVEDCASLLRRCGRIVVRMAASAQAFRRAFM